MVVFSGVDDKFKVSQQSFKMSSSTSENAMTKKKSTLMNVKKNNDVELLPNGVEIKQEPVDPLLDSLTRSNELKNQSEKGQDEKDPLALDDDDDDDTVKTDKNKVHTNSILKRKMSRSSLSTRSSRSSSLELVNEKPEEPSSTQNETSVKPDDNKSSSSDEEDFLGFEPPSTQYRDVFLRAISKENLAPEDDVISQEASSEHMSTDNPPSVDSDSYVMGEITASKRLRSAKKTLSVDLSNPAFKKPFDHGWIRELVYRSTSETSVKRNADVYYYTPSGKKVRSSREVADYLTGDLTIENFTFFKELIGIGDPAKEIIREAKVKPGPKIAEDGTIILPVKKTPKAKSTLTRTPKNTPDSSPKSSSTPRVVLYKTAPVGKSKLAVSNKNKFDKKRKSAGPDDIETSSDNDWSPEQKHPTRDVCSIDCRLAMGLIPTLQCNSCLCLYHPECMGLQREKIRPSHTYVCKNCQVVKPSIASNLLFPPPPLTPIVNVSRPQPQINKPPSPTKRDVKVISVARPPPIVGALTTWLPPSSSIQVSQNSPTPKTSSQSVTTTTPSEVMSHQGLITINGNPYVLIPKQNVVNVSNQNNTTISAVSPGSTDQSVTNLIPTAPGTFVVTSQAQIGKPPHGLFLVPCPVQTPDPGYCENVSQLQIPVVNSSIQAITPVPVQPIGSSSQTNGVKRLNTSPIEGSSPPPEKKCKPKECAQENTSTFLKENFMMNLNAGFTALLHAFQYLKVHELLRAICVSQMWRHIASHRSLWETVRMKNSRVRDWQGFGKALKLHNTKSLDLRKMLLPESPEATHEMWMELSEAISDLPHLKRIDFGRCSPQAIETVTNSCPQLESVVSLSIRGSELDLTPVSSCINLVELKLKSLAGIEIKNLSALKELTFLKVLGLTTVRSIEGIEDVLSESLENLELGDCTKLSENFATRTLPKLVNLKRLRLEKGQINCPTIPILNAVANLSNLTQLELINFDIKSGFDKALAKCTNIKVLLIIPTYVTQSATTNHVVMGGVSKLSQTLVYFIWGLTLELLRVTDLFIDQVEGQKGKTQSGVKKASAGDSIPILKPIGEDGSEMKEGQSASQVDILGLPKLQRVLSTLLPTTKIKILKVPFSATWRQTVTDGPSQ